MIYVFIDPEREYLKVSAALRAAGKDFKLMKTEDETIKRDAESFWSTDEAILKVWAEVDKHDPDLPKPEKQRAKDSAESKSDGADSVS